MIDVVRIPEFHKKKVGIAGVDPCNCGKELQCRCYSCALKLNDPHRIREEVVIVQSPHRKIGGHRVDVIGSLDSEEERDNLRLRDAIPSRMPAHPKAFDRVLMATRLSTAATLSAMLLPCCAKSMYASSTTTSPAAFSQIVRISAFLRRFPVGLLGEQQKSIFVRGVRLGIVVSRSM